MSRPLLAQVVDLAEAVASGRFREDLYYRLAVFPMRLPPLRERSEDVPGIAAAFLEREHHRTRRGPWSLGAAALATLQAWPWPGNVRELINALERAIILQPAGEIDPAHLGLGAGASMRAASPAPASAPDAPLPSWPDNERRYFQALLERTGGKLYGPDGAGALAGLKPTTLRSKLVKLGLR